jgi:hypothetical protein
MDDFNDLQRLLRLKRHEAPPPEFFEDFLEEFHLRQRAELLKRPLWRLALDRLEGAWPVFPVARYAYAGSCALALLAAGITSAHILTTPASVALADAQPAKIGKHSPAIAVPPAAAVASLRSSSGPARIDLRGLRPSVALNDLDFENLRSVSTTGAASRPRYVLDAQPVSYEQPSSF